MYFSIRGTVVFKNSKFVVVESNGIGYEIFVSNPENYPVGTEAFFYLHHQIKEDDEYLSGFPNEKQKELFKLLLHVSGVGPKTALTILGKVNCDDLMSAISNEDIDFVRSIPTVSDHLASQIFLDLKAYIVKNNKDNISQYKEVKQALKALKYKSKEIDAVLLNIYIPNATTQQLIKEALRRLNYAKNF